MDLGDDRGYERWAGIHGLPLPIGCGNYHGSPLFLPWHRAYLYRIERAMRDREPDAMLAWWDWRTPRSSRSKIPAAYAERQVGGEANPLFSASVPRQAIRQGRNRGIEVAAETERAPSRGLPLPTPKQISDLIEIRDFDTFNMLLDSIHGEVHMWVGGHMTAIDFAAYDPIFWAHHAMVDRIWRQWQNRHGQAGPRRSLWDEALEPFGMTVRQTLDVTKLGYDYASGTDTKTS